MKYGICHLSIVPIRSMPVDTSDMISQLLYGDHYKILEERKKWSRVRVAFDHCEGWIRNTQLTEIEETLYVSMEDRERPCHSTDLVSFIALAKNNLIPIVMGSIVHDDFNHTHEGDRISEKQGKPKLVDTALPYLNSPYLWGGKTPFGIDGSGFTQMVYKINGHRLLRQASEQATQGEALSFIEECEAGDLAFFDNSEGIIDHVGIIMENNYIIHVHGKVRIDRIDHTGIFNTETKTYTHKLRVIKKII